jgi:dTDP-4-amino-4,6-dideoxygalactose transaminase
LLADGIQRNLLIHKLNEQGVETNIGAQALHMLSFYKTKYNYKDMDFKNAKKAYEVGLALPIGRHLIPENIKTITDKLTNILKNEF